MARRITLLVSFELPNGATPTEGLGYTVAALQNWHGSLQPLGVDKADDGEAVIEGDAMFDLDPATVKVKLASPWP